MKKPVLFIVMFCVFILSGAMVFGQQPLQVMTITPSMTDAYNQLTPEQQKAMQEELAKTGGVLTPEALVALRMRPEFAGLKPEDIARGKELLEKQEGVTTKALEMAQPMKPEAVKIEPISPVAQKKIIGERAKVPSPFERAWNVAKYQDISRDLKSFGYEFFQEAAIRVVTDTKNIPVPLKYVIGPGDQIKLMLWGRVNAQYDLTVDRDGKIAVPQIGPLYVAGMTFEQMSKYLIKQSEQIVGTNIDISMGSLKTISIYVLGDVRMPGSYTIGSFATITDALLAAGGPSGIGSMRKVQLRRKDKLITTFDLYDLLLKGDKSKDLTLQAGDIVFVPVSGPVVGIAGAVKRPAIYELKDHFDLQNLFDMAGGIIPSAYTQQIQVERIVKAQRQIVVDINDKNLDKARQFQLQDVDLVKVFSIVDNLANVMITAFGNIKKPGTYEFKPGMKIRDVIKGTDDLLPETYFGYALIKRKTPPALETVLVPFNLTKLLLENDPASNLALQARDQIYIFSKWFFQDRPYVTIEGEIRGECNITQDIQKDLKKDESTMPIQGVQKDLEKDAYAKFAQDMKTIEDEMIRAKEYDLAGMVRNIGDELKNYHRVDSANIRILQDKLSKIGRQDFAEQMRQLENRLKNSCKLPLSDNTRVKDIILNAGGLTETAYLDRGEIIRVTLGRIYQTLYFNINGAMASDPQDNLPLQNEDRIVIHSVWEQVYKKSVAIDGEVTRPGSYQYTDQMTVRDLIFKSGNIMESAYVEEAEISSIIVEGRESLKTERKIINLRKALEGDPTNNVTLKPNDRLFVKRIPNWGVQKIVSVIGEVRFPGRYVIHKGEKLSTLLERVGGFTPEAYLRGAVFTRQSVKQLQQQGLEDMAKRLERDLMVQSSTVVSTALSAEEIKANELQAIQKRAFIESLKQLKATGRMMIRLANIRLLKGSEYDIELEEGDTLDIPQINKVINVLGSVMSPGSYVYLNNYTYKDYIDMAGGYTSYADASKTFVLKVDGSARRLDRGFLNWSDSGSRWEMAGFGQETKAIEPGDVIIVPEQFDQIAWLRTVRDISQILMNTAVVAGVVIKLF
ncbi:MAG: SLBB domain-containing protein [Syntrophales bacterium]|jgi:protein involved in polysaccharide export with SLBB domain